jgi:hypothetical protein
MPGVQWRDPDLHEVIEFLSNPNSVIKVIMRLPNDLSSSTLFLKPAFRIRMIRPYVFGPPGSASGSVSHKYGSGSFPFLIKVLSGLK